MAESSHSNGAGPHTNWADRIEVDFQRHGGRPVIRDTKPAVKVEDIVDHLARHEGQVEAVLTRWPKLTADDVRSAITFAAHSAREVHSTAARALLGHTHTISAPPESRRHARVVIIGSGPSGFTAAVYAARANLEPIVIEGKGDPVEKTVMPGGQLMLTTDVENYPGFPVGVTGPDMMAMFRNQARRFGCQIVTDNVVSVDFTRRPFEMTTEDHGLFTSDAVIIATGARAKYLGLDNERRLYNAGVSACATCDGFLFRGKHVAVVGGGDTAMEEANYLTRHASRVTVIHRRADFRASKAMVDRARANPKIEWKLHRTVVDVLGGDHVTGLRLADVNTGATEDFAVDGLFLAIGHSPNTAFLKGSLEADETGYLVTRGKSTYTSIEGVFAAGDVADHVYRQAVTAAGSGCAAAIDCERWLEGQAANH